MDNKIVPHVVWGMVVVALSLIAVIAFGDDEAVEIAGNSLAGLGFIVGVSGFCYYMYRLDRG